MVIDEQNVFRTTQKFPCFSGADVEAISRGAWPERLLWWFKRQGWWGEKRCYLAAGLAKDRDATRVDINPATKPTIIGDARKTGLPDDEFDLVVVDPPSSPQRAKSAYGDEKLYGRIDEFAAEAARITKRGGLIVTLNEEVPRRIPGCEFIAICGIYTAPLMSRMRCCAVTRKGG